MAFFFINEGDDQFTIISFSLPLGCASDPDLRRCPRGSSVYSQLALRIKFFGVTSLTLLCDRFMTVLSTTQFLFHPWRRRTSIATFANKDLR